jgi:molybdopterin/thiamine biosynthesis adenylyltransferase
MDCKPRFSELELSYYSRHIVLDEIGLKGQCRLKESRVLVAGLGGLGSTLSTQLASLGVGYLRLVDRDIVEVSNLQRQHLFGFDVVGYPKVEAAAMRLGKVNPFIELEPIPESINTGNAERLLEGVDIVVDGLDRMAPRYALNRACVKTGTPYVYGAAITHVGNVSTIIPGETPCLECFQGSLDDSNIPTCAIVGVTPPIISIIASIQVSEAVRIILSRKPNLSGRLLFCDLEDLSFDSINLVRAEGCPVCGARRTEPKPIEMVEEICGRNGNRVFVITPEKTVRLNLVEVARRLKGRGFRLDVEAEMGVTFSGESALKGSILVSGVGIFEGLKDREKAISLYTASTCQEVKDRKENQRSNL